MPELKVGVKQRMISIDRSIGWWFGFFLSSRFHFLPFLAKYVCGHKQSTHLSPVRALHFCLVVCYMIINFPVLRRL